MPDEIELRDGRYFAGGYGFYSRDQAEFFLRRTRETRPAPSASPQTVSSKLQPSSRRALPRELKPVEPGVWVDDEERYHAAGYSFSTLAQARDYSRRQWSGKSEAPPTRSLERLPISGAPTTIESKVAPAATARGPERWIGDPTQIQVGDITLTAELTYVGTSLKKDPYSRHNSLIDPALAISSVGDRDGTTLSYWPSYATLDPRARRSYLEWLASGRSDPETPVGYVFIYFYGLERRLIHDKSEADAGAILSELRRLFKIYGANHSFSRYATAAIEIGEAIHGELDASLKPRLISFFSYEIPLGTRIGLGRVLAARQPLDADQSLAWILALPDTYLRTPAKRCFDELVGLWRVRFGQRHPEGLAIRPPKACIKIQYRAASAGFNADATIDLPDISHVAAPVPRLRELLMACSDELDGLSRFLGKSPDARGTLEAAVLLPRELREQDQGLAVRECLEKFHDAMEDRARATLSASQLLGLLNMDWPQAGEPLATTDLKQIIGILDALDVGFEPDKRYSASGPLLADTPVCIFKAKAGGPVPSDTERYAAARTLIEIAALAATADGVVVPLELEAIERDLESLDLLEIERERLRAHAEAILLNPPKAKGAIKRLLALAEVRRRRIAESAISAVLADGHVLPSEVRFLESLFKSLGLPNEDVYAQLHRGAVEFDEPVNVAGAIARSSVPIPPETVENGAFKVDAARLERLRKETLEVSSLLATIFVEEADTPVQPAIEATSAQSPLFVGLDNAHGDLLTLLLSKPMERSEFAEEARARKLLPDGALETINDWGFDRFDELAIEDEDMILVAAHLLEPIRAMQRGSS